MTDVLVTLYCHTHYPTSTVLWKRNNVEVPIDGFKYEAIQVLHIVGRSYYNNSLIIRDIAGVIDQPEYTCEVSNNIGSRTGTINLYRIPTVSMSLSGKTL